MRPLARLAQPQPQFDLEGVNIGWAGGGPLSGTGPNTSRGHGRYPSGPGPGFDPDEYDAQGLAKDRSLMWPSQGRLMPSVATPALRQAGYTPAQGNRLIRLARRGQLGQFQDPSGAYHDPTIGRNDPRAWYDPTPPVQGPPVAATPTRGGYTPSPVDPVVGDERLRQPTDPGYYGGFRTPAAQQGLEAVAARWAARRARRAG